MSFAATKPQFLDYSKDVTRRGGWEFLKPGQIVMAIEKGQGLKKGEKQKTLGAIEILEVTRERLNWITQAEVEREGFPNWGRREFIEMYCRMNRVKPTTVVTRIRFRRLD